MLSSATQQATPPEFNRQCELEIPWFPMPTFICAGYRIKEEINKK